jgi:leucine dehydrogenase
MTDWKQLPAYDGHEDLIPVGDEALGFAGYIAIHSTALGPAAGGCRIWTYDREEDALTDVLRLSRGMSYKNAMAELPLGGGKTVLYRMGPDRAACFQKFGEQVEALGGRYITAEDVGASVEDMRIVARRTAYVAGLPKEQGQAGGDPSPVTARGVFYCIEALLGGAISGKRIAVQGVGHVGLHLCKLLAERGARLVVSDVNADNLASARALGAEVAPVNDIHKVAADLFSPCALGAGLNEETIPELGAPIICGAANNQLATEADGARLVSRGVTYAPDYVVNAGGIINVSAEYLGEPADVVEARIRAIATRLMKVIEAAKANGVPPNEAADRIVRERLAAAQKDRP